jgi:proteic killer suppression protein
MTIVSFKNEASGDIAYGENTKEARRLLPAFLHQKARRWLALLDATRSLEGLSSPGLSLEKLKGDRAGQWSLRINNKYRICFYWQHAKASEVEIVDYH